MTGRSNCERSIANHAYQLFEAHVAAGRNTSGSSRYARGDRHRQSGREPKLSPDIQAPRLVLPWRRCSSRSQRRHRHARSLPLPLASQSVDVVISGQALEHIEYFWITFLDMVRVLKRGGKMFLIAPSRGPEHRYPVDCWRFYPDGFRALARFGRVNLIEVSTDWEPDAAEGSAAWGDTVGGFKNDSLGWWRMLGREITLPCLRAWARSGTRCADYLHQSAPGSLTPRGGKA